MSDNILAETCLRCGYEWEPRVTKPKNCPRCKSHKWAEPREITKTND